MNANINKSNAANIEAMITGTAGRLTAFLGAGFTGIIVVPTLSILSVVFTAVGIGVFTVPFLNLLGIMRIPYYVLTFPVLGLPQVLVGAVTGAMLVLAGAVCGIVLIKYFRLVKFVFSGK